MAGTVMTAVNQTAIETPADQAPTKDHASTYGSYDENARSPDLCYGRDSPQRYTLRQR